MHFTAENYYREFVAYPETVLVKPKLNDFFKDLIT